MTKNYGLGNMGCHAKQMTKFVIIKLYIDKFKRIKFLFGFFSTESTFMNPW